MAVIYNSYHVVGEHCLGKLTLFTSHRKLAYFVFPVSYCHCRWTTSLPDLAPQLFSPPAASLQRSLVVVFRVILQGVLQEFNELFQDCTWMFGRDSHAPGPPHKTAMSHCVHNIPQYSTMNHEFQDT